MLGCEAGGAVEGWGRTASAAKETGLGKLFLFRRVNIQDQNITEQF